MRWSDASGHKRGATAAFPSWELGAQLWARDAVEQLKEVEER